MAQDSNRSRRGLRSAARRNSLKSKSLQPTKAQPPKAGVNNTRRFTPANRAKAIQRANGANSLSSQYGEQVTNNAIGIQSTRATRTDEGSTDHNIAFAHSPQKRRFRRNSDAYASRKQFGDRPKSKVTERLKRNGLKDLMGRQLNAANTYDSVSATPTTASRSALYYRSTKGALGKPGEYPVASTRLPNNVWRNAVTGKDVTFDPKTLREPLRKQTNSPATLVGRRAGGTSNIKATLKAKGNAPKPKYEKPTAFSTRDLAKPGKLFPGREKATAAAARSNAEVDLIRRYEAARGPEARSRARAAIVRNRWEEASRGRTFSPAQEQATLNRIGVEVGEMLMTPASRQAAARQAGDPTRQLSPRGSRRIVPQPWSQPPYFAGSIRSQGRHRGTEAGLGERGHVFERAYRNEIVRRGLNPNEFPGQRVVDEVLQVAQRETMRHFNGSQPPQRDWARTDARTERLRANGQPLQPQRRSGPQLRPRQHTYSNGQIHVEGLERRSVGAAGAPASARRELPRNVMPGTIRSNLAVRRPSIGNTAAPISAATVKPSLGAKAINGAGKAILPLTTAMDYTDRRSQGQTQAQAASGAGMATAGWVGGAQAGALLGAPLGPVGSAVGSLAGGLVGQEGMNRANQAIRTEGAKRTQQQQQQERRVQRNINNFGQQQSSNLKTDKGSLDRATRALGGNPSQALKTPSLTATKPQPQPQQKPKPANKNSLKLNNEAAYILNTLGRGLLPYFQR